MKKTIRVATSVLLVALFATCAAIVCSCSGTDEFFSAEVLEELNLSDMPSPKGAGRSELAEQNVYRCRVKQAEFAEYARSVYGYLAAKQPLIFGTDGGDLNVGENVLARSVSDCSVFEDFRTDRYEYKFIFASFTVSGLLVGGTAVEIKYDPNAKPYNMTVTVDKVKNYYREIEYSVQMVTVPYSRTNEVFMWKVADNIELKDDSVFKSLPLVKASSEKELSEFTAALYKENSDCADFIEGLGCYNEEYFEENDVVIVCMSNTAGYEYYNLGYSYDGVLNFHFSYLDDVTGGDISSYAVIEIKKDVGLNISMLDASFVK